MQPVENGPIHLTAAATVSANSQQGVNAISLKNPTGQAMELLEVKWLLSTRELIHVTGGTIGCKLDLGSIPITNGFVPVWNFAPSTKFDFETVSNAGRQAVGYQWKLHRPLYIPPGAVVVPTFHHFGQIPNDIDVRISYSCRTLPAGYKLPPRVPVPYVAYWSTKVFELFSFSEDRDQSRETDLVNRFNEPLRIHRFVGRWFTFEPLNNFGHEADNTGPSRLVQVRMVDSRGEPVIPQFTFFRQVFSAVTRSWEVDYIVPPQTFYIVSARRLASGPPPFEDANKLGQGFISMVTTREMRAAA